MTQYAPIAYFAFNRPQHTARTLAALSANPEAAETDLHIFVDGARHALEQPAVDEVLRLAHATEGFRSVSVHASPSNQGLYHSITQGVSRVIGHTGRVIVVEDDILVSRHFLAYMNDALNTYQDLRQVGCIHAYSPSADGFPDYFFLRGGDCWGWATWADRWLLYRADTRGLVHDLVASRQLAAYLDVNGHHSLVHLVKRAKGRNQSWASNWHASLFLANRLTLHPGQSYVENIGNDGSGTHAAISDVYSTSVTSSYDGIHTVPVAHNDVCARIMRDFLDDVAHESPGRKLRRVLITMLIKAQAIAIYVTYRPRQSMTQQSTH
ncbi:hypothetical protein [Dyella subtropica]|uniref:hypothetical protein n=1 Tax=Dyella subtropica TaxID=2992127 RepID=UPI002259B5D0|nr:hypothetical protein [Dyella subtropica]